MDVAVTGAAGEVGRLALDALEASEGDTVHPITHGEHDDIESTVLEMTDADAFAESTVGADALVHLAWGPADPEDWNAEHEANVRGTANALEAARENDLDRVVVASSIHVSGMYNRKDPGAFESLDVQPTTPVGASDRSRPDSFYGVAKVACEGLSSFYADRYDLEVVVLRIGWVMSAEELRDVESFEEGRRRFARATWLSPRDCRNAIARSVHAPISRSPIVAFVTSANDDRVSSLTEAMVHLGYRPRDNAAQVLTEE